MSAQYYPKQSCLDRKVCVENLLDRLEKTGNEIQEEQNRALSKITSTVLVKGKLGRLMRRYCRLYKDLQLMWLSWIR